MNRSSFPSVVLRAVLCVAALIFFHVNSARATEQKDIVVGLKALPLLTSKIAPDAQVAVIYDPASAASRADADGIKRVFDAGVEKSGDEKLSASLVGVGELNKMPSYKIAFLTPGLAAHYDAIGAATAAAGVLTITTDTECVRANKCVLGVVTNPEVAIYYSKSAADAAKIDFSSAFVMLVKHL